MHGARFAADDWGLSPAINAGILRLAEEGCLHSVSIMATAGYLNYRLAELLEYTRSGLRLSLHFNLTYGKPLSSPDAVASLIDPLTGEFYSHRRLILRGFSNRIAGEDVVREFIAQLTRLENHKVPVSGVDGHHHVHLLPGVAGPLQDVLAPLHLSLRLIEDREHRPSYLQTLVYKLLIARRDIEFETCGYMLPEDLRSAGSFRAKVSQGRPVLVHPALYNDFDSSGMLDPMRDERVHELNSILKYLND